MGLTLVVVFLFPCLDLGLDFAVDGTLALTFLRQVSFLVALEAQVSIHVLLVLLLGELILGIVRVWGGGGSFLVWFGGGFVAAAALAFEVLEIFIDGDGRVDEGGEVRVDKVHDPFGDLFLESPMDSLDPEVISIPPGSVTSLLDLVDEEAGTGGLCEFACEEVMGSLGHFLGVNKAGVELGDKEGPCGKVGCLGLLGKEAELVTFPLLCITPHALEGEADLLFLHHVVEGKIVVALVDEALGLVGFAIKCGGEVGFDLCCCCWCCCGCGGCGHGLLDMDDGGWQSGKEGLELGLWQAGLVLWGLQEQGALQVGVLWGGL